MNQLKKLIKLELLIVAIQLKKLTRTQKLKKLTADNFSGRLAQENLASNDGIVNLVKKTDFDIALKHFYKKSYFK